MRSESASTVGHSEWAGLPSSPGYTAWRSLQAAHDLFSEVRPQRDRFARALGLRWTQIDETKRPDEDPENWSVNAVNYSFRYMGYLKSMASGLPPVIKYPREAGAGQIPETSPREMAASVPGDEKLAEWAEILISRAVADSGALVEWRDAIDDIGAWGSGCVAIGFDREAVSLTLNENANRSVEDISAAALRGEVNAKPGERHLEAESRLVEMLIKAGNEDDPYTLTGDEAQNLSMRAQSHAAMSVLEAKQPLPMGYTRHKIWARRCQVGVDVFWDSTVTRLDDLRWMARRLEMTLEEFQASELFRPKYKKLVKGTGRRGETGFDGEEQYRQDYGRDDANERVVVLYEYWERKPEMKSGGVRRFLCKEVPGEFIERDNTNPYLDEEGRPLIPGFFPIYVSTPLRSPENDPKRTFGIPAVAPGWPQQMEANTLRTLSLASAKRHSLRAYVISQAFKGKGNAKARRLLTEGKDGVTFLAPHGIKTAAEMKGLVVPIDHSGNNGEIEKQELYNKGIWREVQGVPAAVLAGQGASDTLGQDEMALAAGKNQQHDVLGQIELVFANMCEGVRGLLKKFPIEKIAAMVGVEGAQIVEVWKTSSLDGDALIVSFGARAAAQEAVEKKQLMEVIAMLQAWVDPSGMPMVDPTPYYSELVRAMGLGKLQLIDPGRKREMQMAQIAEQIIEAVGEDGVGAILNGTFGEEGGQTQTGNGSPVKASSDDPRGPSNANISVGAKRGAKTVNN